MKNIQQKAVSTVQLWADEVMDKILHDAIDL